MIVTIHQAKTHLSRLLVRVAAGEEVVIAKARTPVARLVPVKPRRPARQLGTERRRLRIPRNFDAPLPEAILKAFER